MAVTASAFMFSGFHINHLDLSPKFVGTLMGIANGLENISAIIAPLTVGLFVKNQVSFNNESGILFTKFYYYYFLKL